MKKAQPSRLKKPPKKPPKKLAADNLCILVSHPFGRQGRGKEFLFRGKDAPKQLATDNLCILVSHVFGGKGVLFRGNDTPKKVNC